MFSFHPKKNEIGSVHNDCLQPFNHHNNEQFSFFLISGLEAQVQESSKDLYWFWASLTE